MKKKERIKILEERVKQLEINVAKLQYLVPIEEPEDPFEPSPMYHFPPVAYPIEKLLSNRGNYEQKSNWTS